MAAKDNQGLQAIIIVLVILVILLGAGLIFVNNSKKTAQARANDAETRASDSQTAQARLQNEANNYKTWMGFTESDAYESIQKTVEEDLAEYGEHFEAENRAYRKILAANADELRNSAQNEAKAKEQGEKLAEDIKSLQNESAQRLKAATDALEQAKQDMAAELNKFKEQREEFKRQTEKINGQLSEERTQHAQQVAEHQTTIKNLSSRTDDLERAITLLQENQVEPDPFAEPADGKITWVNQRYAKAWINLGSADGLRPQVSFSVYAPNELDATDAVKKASVEVVRVVEPHLAEVRITSDSAKNPLVPGDKIYSQVWDRGRKLGFGIAGVIDLDGDHQSDLELLKRIIRSNNGRIDAAPGEETKMTVQTRYLILGELPTGSQPGADEIRDSWSKLTEKADDLNIETIPADEFVKLMGWKSENKAVTLGATARPADFPAEAGGQKRPPKRAHERGTFKKRLPQTPY